MRNGGLISGAVVALSAIAVLTASARAQDAGVINGSLPLNAGRSEQVTDRFQRQLDQLRETDSLRANTDVPVGRRALIDFGGYFAPSYLSLDDQTGDNRVLREYDFVGYGRFSLDGAHEVFARYLTRVLDYNPDDSFDGRGSRTQFIPDRLYYKFDLQKALAAYEGKATNDDLVIQVGRQLVDWGAGLTLNLPLDAGLVGATIGPVDVTALGGATPVQNTIDFDSSRPGFDAHTSRAFYGLLAAYNVANQRPYVYVLQQDDNNKDRVRETGPVTTRYGYDSTYFAVGSTGSLTDKLLYSAEVAYENGRTLSNSFTTAGGTLAPVPQTRDRVDSFAGDFRLDYAFNDAHRTRLSAETILATGSTNRLVTNTTFGGPTPNSTDRAFNAFGLLNTGLAFSPTVSNLIAQRVGVSTSPFAGRGRLDRLQVGADVFFYGKFTNGAPIDEPTDRTGQYLGTEPDLFLNWQLASDVTLSLRYGVFVPDTSVVTQRSTRQFLFAGATFAF